MKNIYRSNYSNPLFRTPTGLLFKIKVLDAISEGKPITLYYINNFDKASLLRDREYYALSPFDHEILFYIRNNQDGYIINLSYSRFISLPREKASSISERQFYRTIALFKRRGYILKRSRSEFWVSPYFTRDKSSDVAKFIYLNCVNNKDFILIKK